MQRLEKVAGRKTLRLTHYGRKTGKPYAVTIWFVVDGDRVYIGTANEDRQWVRNVQKTPRVELAIGGQKLEGTARFLADRVEHSCAQRKMAAKYWMFWPILALGRALMATGIMRDRTGFFEVTLN